MYELHIPFNIKFTDFISQTVQEQEAGSQRTGFVQLDHIVRSPNFFEEALSDL